MRLKSEFIKLPLCFEVEKLQQEIAAFDEDDWCPHPQGFAGNSALLLISAHGSIADDGMKGPMLPTSLLKKSPYLQQVLSSFGTIFGRTRLMRLDGNAEANKHMDASYYWHQRMRVHVPIQTHPEVDFLCGDKHIHMKAGESWIFDTWEKHNVINPINKTRIHLVADTVGSARFQRLIDKGFNPFLENKNKQILQKVEFDTNKHISLTTEKINFPVVMTPWEQESLLAPIIADLNGSSSIASEQIIQVIESFKLRWKATWHAHGDSLESDPFYQATLALFRNDFKKLEGKVMLPNGMEAVGLIYQAVFESALSPELRNLQSGVNTPLQQQVPVVANSQNRNRTPVLGEPIIILAAPRSGSTLLFETLAQSPDLYTVGGESHGLIESIESLTPQANGYESNRLTESHVTPTVANQIKINFINELRDRNGKAIKANLPPIRMLEKTPKNALRIPFLSAIFPRAKFIYLYRNPRENISSIIDAWKSGRFVTYKKLPERKSSWSLLLIPGWRNLPEEDVAFTAASQWKKAHETMLEDVAQMSSKKVLGIRYEDFLENPQVYIEKICEFVDISWDKNLEKNLPLSRHTLTKPDPYKWKNNAEELKRVLPIVQQTQEKVECFLKK